MTDEHSTNDLRAAIDRRLETVFETENDARVPAAREAVAEDEDRWYGRLLVRSYGSVADSMDSEATLSAAAAMELLRGYCRLRSELLVQITDDVAHSLTRDPTSALLAGDFLYSAAFTTLAEIDHSSRKACFEVLTDVSERVVEAFSRNYVRSTSTTASRRQLIDGTAGALGEGAAVIGVTLAGGGEPLRENFAALGRGLGAGRQIRQTLDAEGGSVRVAFLERDQHQFRQHAERRLAAATEALRSLSAAADADRLRPLVADVEGGDA